MKGKSLIGVILAAICVTVTYLLPGSEELSHEGITALGVLGMASILWISNTLPFGVTGLLALVMLVLLGVSDMASVFVGFSNSSVIFVITVFCLTAAVMNTKLKQGHRRRALRQRVCRLRQCTQVFLGRHYRQARSRRTSDRSQDAFSVWHTRSGKIL